MFESPEIPDDNPSVQTTGAQDPQVIYHPRLGDLSAHRAFVMGRGDRQVFSYAETSPLYIHLSVTGRCQANCRGCINIAFTDGNSRKIPPFKDTDPVRDARCIVNLIAEKSAKTAIVCLYGGEPLLVPDKIRTLVENIDKAPLPRDVRYMLYTNGELLGETLRSHPEIIRAIWLYSVSIDGTRPQHERIRRGTSLARIHDGLEAIKNIRQGRVLMWSTLREDQSLMDCFNEFTWLHDRGLADQFFWHWVESSDHFSSLSRYAAAYEADLRRIMEIYVAGLMDNIILPVTHINELVLYLLSGKKRQSTACGVELADNYDILDGKIHACADLPVQYAIGTIGADGTPHMSLSDLSGLTLYKKDLGCGKCGVHGYCGGRCPVQAVTGSAARLKQYCQLMRLHVATVNDYLPEIVRALEKNSITAQCLYERSAYYAQFTDGTP